MVESGNGVGGGIYTISGVGEAVDEVSVALQRLLQFAIAAVVHLVCRREWGQLASYQCWGMGVCEGLPGLLIPR